MSKTSTLLLGAGALMATLALPVAARADSDDRALAFAVGAVVGHALGDNHAHARPVHRRIHTHRPVIRPFRWHQRHKAFHHNWRNDHRRFHGRGHGQYDRHDHRRHERRDRDRDRRHHRRGRDDHDRRDHGRRGGRRD